jgi:hypothetical protein
MDTRKRGFMRWLALCFVLALQYAWPGALGAAEDKFDELQIGARTYRNVTVTTRTTNYVFLLHSEGMSNFKYSELSPEERHKLGFPEPAPPQVKTNIAEAWAKQALSKLDEPRLRDAKEQALNLWHENYARALEKLPPLTPKAILIAAGALLILHLLWSFCIALICLKVDKPGGIMAWVPVLQTLPMLNAAGMSAWWFPVLFIPVVNLLPGILWCVKIVSARGKNGLLALLLIVPTPAAVLLFFILNNAGISPLFSLGPLVIGLLAFLYLVFSNGETPTKSDDKMKIMALQDA